MIKLLLLAISIIALAHGQEISEVTNVKVTPKAKAESTAVIFTWDAPSKLGSNAATDLKYTVKYCEINTPKCKDSGNITERRFEATGLKKNFLYNYAITAFGKDGTAGKIMENVVKTKAKDTCSDTQFTCAASAGCIDPVKKCDGIVNCLDTSDEGAPAGCTVPANKPGNILIAEIEETSFVVNYKKVTASDRATGYKIEVLNTVTNQKTTKSDDHSNFGAPIKSKTVSGLEGGVEYKLRIRAINRAGAGPWSDEVSVRTKGVPLKVGNVKAKPKAKQESTAFILTWDIPADLAGNTEADLKYQVIYCQINRKDSCMNTTLNNNRKVEITGLKKDFIYSYTITTYDKDNKAASVYEQIYRTKAADTCQSTQYTCAKSLDCIDPTRKCDGIVNCHDGSDEDGNGGCTAPSEKPADLTIEDIKEESFVVKYKKVEPKERATGYEIEIVNTKTKAAIKKNDKHNNFGSVIRSVTVSELTEGAEYQVRVRAMNRVGAGLWTEFKTVKTNERTVVKSLVVTNVKATAKPLKETTAFTLTWDAPKDLGDNTEADLKYEVKYCVINRDDTCKVKPLTAEKKVDITGLQVRMIYSYHITTFGKDSTKGPDHADTYRTKSKDTCLPNQYTCTQSNQCIDPKRKCDGLVSCSDGSDENADADCTVPSFKPKKIFIESIKSDSFVIKFEQVAAQDRATKYEIEIRNTVKDTLMKKVKAHNPYGTPVITVSVFSLDGATEYVVRIRAVNRVGDGSWSDEVKVTTKEAAAVLLKVANVKVTPKPLKETSAVKITWDTPKNLGASSESDLMYVVTYCEINRKTTCKNTSKTADTKVDITGLKKYFLYNYHVKTFGKDDATGEAFDGVFRTGQKRTCLPNQFTCAASDGCVGGVKKCDGMVNCKDSSDEKKDAGCSAPRAIPGSTSADDITSVSFVYKFRQVIASERATGYEVLVTANGEEVVKYYPLHETYGVAIKSVVVSKLKPNREYKVQIRVINRVSSGDWSSETVVTTKGIGSVTSVKATPQSNGVNIRWEAPTELNGAGSAFEYLIRYCRIENGKKTECKEAKTTRKLYPVSNLKPDSTYEYEVVPLSGGKPASSAPFSSSFKTTSTSGGNGKGGPDTTSDGEDGDDSGGMSTAQKIGIAVGIVLGLIILIIAIVACTKMRKSGKKSHMRSSSGKQNGGYEMDRK